MSKSCRTCAETKPLTQFPHHRRDGYGPDCRACYNLARAQRDKARQGEQKAILRQLKDAPCTDCSNRFPPVCMDFDHVHGRKEFNLGDISTRPVTWEKLLAEIAKCELVCANCHRIRTAARLLAPPRRELPPGLAVA